MLQKKRFSIKTKIIVGSFIFLTFATTEFIKRKAERPVVQISMEDRATNYKGTF